VYASAAPVPAGRAAPAPPLLLSHWAAPPRLPDLPPARREPCPNAPVHVAAAVPAARPARLGGAGLQSLRAPAQPGAYRLGRHRCPAAAPPRPGPAAGGCGAGLRRP